MANGRIRQTRAVNPDSRYRDITPDWMKQARMLTGDHPETGVSLSDAEACRRAAGADRPKSQPVYDQQDVEDTLYEKELKKLDAKLGIDED